MDLIFFILFQLSLGAVIHVSKSEIVDPTMWLIWYLCSICFILLIAHRRRILRLWFKGRETVGDILWAMKMFPILFLTVMAISFIFPPERTENLQLNLDAMTILILVVIGPFGEELIFRGFLYEYMRQRLKKETAIIFTSLIFALFHPISSFPVVMTLAVMLNFLYEMRDNIMVPVVLHSLNNLVVLILYEISRR